MQVLGLSHGKKQGIRQSFPASEKSEQGGTPGLGLVFHGKSHVYKALIYPGKRKGTRAVSCNYQASPEDGSSPSRHRGDENPESHSDKYVRFPWSNR